MTNIIAFPQQEKTKYIVTDQALSFLSDGEELTEKQWDILKVQFPDVKVVEINA